MKHPLGQKLYFSISEVAELTDLQPYILRTWDKEFTCLRPRRLRGKNRAYRQRDINLILLIKRLLYEERFTVQGVRQKLKNDAALVREAVEFDGDLAAPEPDQSPDGEGATNGAAAETAPLPAAPPLPVAPSLNPTAHGPYPTSTPPQGQEMIAQIRAELQALLRLLA